MKEKLKAFFKVIAENWKIILGGVVGFLSILLGIFGYEKITKFFGKDKTDDETDEVIKHNEDEIAKTKKWVKENKKLHESNEEALNRYNKFLANNVPNS